MQTPEKRNAIAQYAIALSSVVVALNTCDVKPEYPVGATLPIGAKPRNILFNVAKLTCKEYWRMIRKLFLAISTRKPLSLSNPAVDHFEAVVVHGSGICNFIAMEYYLGILNRTYLVSGFKNGIGGARVFGVMGNPGYMSPETAADPQTYVSPTLSKQYGNVSFDSPSFLTLDSANFFYPMKDVAFVSDRYDAEMGYG